MEKNADNMTKRLKRADFAGVILYEGPSRIDGEPVVVIATKITGASANVKTGAMVQTFILRADVAPLDALKSGADKSVCGDCQFRPANGGGCYVNVGQAPRSVYVAYTKGRYARPGVDYDRSILPELFADTLFRLGSYGDPAACPVSIWDQCTTKVRAKNGYTHQWRRFPSFKRHCMASCDDPADFTEATGKGWRTFRVRLASEPIHPKEISCPASHEAGQKTTCAACRACGGTSAKAKVNIAIIAHGSTAKRYIEKRNAA